MLQVAMMTHISTQQTRSWNKWGSDRRKLGRWWRMHADLDKHALFSSHCQATNNHLGSILKCSVLQLSGHQTLPDDRLAYSATRPAKNEDLSSSSLLGSSYSETLPVSRTQHELVQSVGGPTNQLKLHSSWRFSWEIQENMVAQNIGSHLIFGLEKYISLERIQEIHLENILIMSLVYPLNLWNYKNIHITYSLLKISILLPGMNKIHKYNKIELSASVQHVWCTQLT